MNKENGDSPEKNNIIRLLDIKERDHGTIAQQYEQKHNLLYAKLRGTVDIKERIRLQNILLELEDAFLEYQTSIHHRAK